LKQATNGVPIDGFGRTIEPIERREGVVIPGGRIGAVFEEDRNSLYETCLRGIVQCSRVTAVISLARKAPVIGTRAMTKERGDKLRIVSSTLISSAREPDPGTRSIDARSSAREQLRELGVENPTPRPDARRVGAMIKQHPDHRDALARSSLADCPRAAKETLVRLLCVREQKTQRFDTRTSDRMMNGRDIESIDGGIHGLRPRRLVYEITVKAVEVA